MEGKVFDLPGQSRIACDGRALPAPGNTASARQVAPATNHGHDGPDSENSGIASTHGRVTPERKPGQEKAGHHCVSNRREPTDLSKHRSLVAANSYAVRPNRDVSLPSPGCLTPPRPREPRQGAPPSFRAGGYFARSRVSMRLANSWISDFCSTTVSSSFRSASAT